MELPDYFKENENIINDETEICNKFNEYFIHVGPKLSEKIPDNDVLFLEFLWQRSVNSIFLDPVTENEIAQINGNKSCGHDEMSPKVVEIVLRYIIKPLTHNNYNQALCTGVIPSDLKVAIIVTPIFKANYKKLFSN